MKIYLNYMRRPFVLTHEALEMMGRPRFITFAVSKQTNTVIIIPLKSRRGNIGGCYIPESVYRFNGAYAVETTYDFLEQMYFLSDVSGLSVYEVEAEPCIIDELDAKRMHGLEHSVKVKGISLKLNMMNATETTFDLDHVFTFGGYRLA